MPLQHSEHNCAASTCSSERLGKAMVLHLQC